MSRRPWGSVTGPSAPKLPALLSSFFHAVSGLFPRPEAYKESPLRYTSGTAHLRAFVDMSASYHYTLHKQACRRSSS